MWSWPPHPKILRRPLVAALWLTADVRRARPRPRLAAQKTPNVNHPPPPFAALFPLEAGVDRSTLPAAPAAPASARRRPRLSYRCTSETARRARLGERRHASGRCRSRRAPRRCRSTASCTSPRATSSTRSTPPPAPSRGRIAPIASPRVASCWRAGLACIGVGQRPRAGAFDAGVAARMAWTQRVPTPVNRSGAAATGDALLVCLRRRTPRRSRWRSPTASARGRRRSRAGRARRWSSRTRVYVGSTNNRFYALDATERQAALDVADRRRRHRRGADAKQRKPCTTRRSTTSSAPSIPATAISGGNATPAHAPSRPPHRARWQRGRHGSHARPLSAFAPLTGAPAGHVRSARARSLAPPLVSPALVPVRSAMAVVLKDGRAYGLRRSRCMFNESALRSLTALPARPPARTAAGTPASADPVANG